MQQLSYGSDTASGLACTVLKTLKSFPFCLVFTGFKKLSLVTLFLSRIVTIFLKNSFYCTTRDELIYSFMWERIAPYLKKQALLWANLTQLSSFPTEIGESNFSQSITNLSILWWLMTNFWFSHLNEIGCLYFFEMLLAWLLFALEIWLWRGVVVFSSLKTRI